MLYPSVIGYRRATIFDVNVVHLQDYETSIHLDPYKNILGKFVWSFDISVLSTSKQFYGMPVDENMIV